MSNTVLKMINIDKSFAGVHALDNVNFELEKGEVHALVGENGAGKSTLIKILAGAYSADSGEIFVNGKKVKIKNTNDSQKLGISVIYQELILAGNMTVAENIYMGREFKTKSLVTVDYKRMKKETKKILDEIGVSIDPGAKVYTLSTSQQQIVDIAKALSIDANIIVMDEPTATLTKNEVDRLFTTIDNLKKKGISIIYISHRIEEIFRIGDRVTVLRDGQYIGTKKIDETDKNKLIKMMVGREIEEYYKHNRKISDEVVFEARNISTPDKLKNISISLRKGEILGISGLIGAGRTELAQALFGIDDITSGELYLGGKKIKFKTPIDAIKNGVVLVPESRKEQGLVLIKSVGFNITLCVLQKFIKFICVNKNKERSIIKEFFNKLSIKAYSSEQLVVNLSGGNQQKVVLAKWLATKPKILILDEPTKGIDVGAKAEIYSIMNNLIENGASIIMISSELPEIVNMSDRVYIMYDGEIAGYVEKDEIEQERILRYAIGGN